VAAVSVAATTTTNTSTTTTAAAAAAAAAAPAAVSLVWCDLLLQGCARVRLSLRRRRWPDRGGEVSVGLRRVERIRQACERHRAARRRRRLLCRTTRRRFRGETVAARLAHTSSGRVCRCAARLRDDAPRRRLVAGERRGGAQKLTVRASRRCL
jgi:hypothetical protein